MLWMMTMMSTTFIRMLTSKLETIVLGLDPGLADTGFAFLSKNNQVLTLLECGSIKTAKNLKLAERLLSLESAIKKLLVKYPVDLVSIEKLYFARNVTTGIDVAQARGVAMLTLAKEKKQILEFTPLQVKQTLTGSGAAQKRQVGLMVKTILKLKEVPRPDDAADAAAVAICGAWFNQKLSLAQ